MTITARRVDATDPQTGVATRLEKLLTLALGIPVPFRLRAWDGSEAGSDDGPVLVVRSRNALRRLLFCAPELGLARAFVKGDIEIEGDLRTGLGTVWEAVRTAAPRRATRRPAVLGALLLEAARLGALGRPPAPPISEARLRGRLHSIARDRAVIAHHYDLSNEFYEILLDPTMAYSCAYWDDEDGDDLHHAQLAKLDLVCRKLGLTEGDRLLDVGCGWGSLTLHAAAKYGATVTAVTLSANQADHVRSRATSLGLGEQVDVVLSHYRELPRRAHDAVCSIEMGEHVGAGGYPDFSRWLFSSVREGGRVLVQQMSRPSHSPGGGPFIEAYIAPDMYMRPVGETVALLEDGGLEVVDVQAMREHYAKTCFAWYERLEAESDQLVALVGEEVVRVWRLYLCAIGLGFAMRSTGVDQILAVRPGATTAESMASPWPLGRSRGGNPS